MGKGYILDDLGEGRYLAKIMFDRRIVEKQLELLQDSLDKLNEQYLSELLTDKGDWRATELKIKALEKKIQEINDSAPESEEREVWCADYSEELRPGEVGMIETHGTLGGSPFELVLIKPGYNEGSTYLQGEDGILVQNSGQLPYQWLFNWMCLPGWQKEVPLYRVGTIIYLDHDLNIAHVQMDDQRSAAQRLPILPEGQEILNNIPVKYMQCDSFAFEEGDRVIVKFKERTYQGEKEIVGFESNPQPCPIFLRVSMNGFVCSYAPGGKKVRVVQQNETTHEWEQVGESQNIDVSNGIAGPFSGVDLARPFRAQLYYQSNSYVSGSPLYWFQYFLDGTEEDHEIHLRFFVAEDSTVYWGLDKKRFGAFVDGDKITSVNPDSIEERHWYLKRLEWNTNDTGSIQGEPTVMVDTGDPLGKVKAYDVNFECKVIRYRHDGFTDEGSPFPYYMQCRDRGTTPLVYDLPDSPHMIKEGWGYSAMFAGDKKNGNWTYDPLGYSQGHPQAGFDAVNSLVDAWGDPPYSWVAVGNWFLNLYYAVNLQGCSSSPMIMTMEDGTIVYEPPKIIFKVANVIHFISGGCIQDWKNECIEGTGILPCGVDYKNTNDTERHTWTYEPAEIPEDFI